MIIRKAGINDVDGIANVHVESWRSTYSEIISDNYLSKLSFERRVKNWIWTFNNPNPDEVIFVVENKVGKIVGFCSGGKSRSDEYHYEAELYAIYILKEFQGQGLGKALVNALAEHLRTNHYKSLMLWVLEKNPSTEFYKRIGGDVFSKKDIRLGEENLTEVAIGWDNLIVSWGSKS